jgi:hypothetical protein
MRRATTRKRAIMGLLAGIFFLPPLSAEGQVAWDGPLLSSPSAPSGWGVYLTDPSHGSGIGVLGTWNGGGPLGFRLGLAEGRRDDLAVYGGVDLAGALVRASSDFPLDMDWVTGAGLGVGDAMLLSFPLGLSLGRAVSADGVWFNPYVTPRVVLDAWMGTSRPRDELDMRIAVDLGIDLAFDPGWAIRFGATLGKRNVRALAVGASFQAP